MPLHAPFNRTARAALAVAGTLAVGFAVAPTAVASSGAPAPHIVATPDNVMVNTDIRLVGRNFAPDRKLLIADCSERSWVEPRDPCVQSSAITVRTDATGRFTHKMKAGFCDTQAKASGPDGTSIRCWIGDEVGLGSHRLHLVGATRITVTGP